MRVGKNVTVVYFKKYSNEVIGPIISVAGSMPCDGRWTVTTCVQEAIKNKYRPASAVGFRIYRDYRTFDAKKASLLTAGFYKFTDDPIRPVEVDWNFMSTPMHPVFYGRA